MAVEDRLRHRPRSASHSHSWYARIATTATDYSVQVYVIIPAFSDQHRFGPCRWMPRGNTMPARGDEALIVFDNYKFPWIIAWWPVG